MSRYEPPELKKLGSVEDVTLGGRFSNPDGMSGTSGNRGSGNANR